MDDKKEKQYGLINMKKTKSSQPLMKKLAVFDESDEEDTPQSAINQKLQREAVKTKMRKQTKMEIQQALAEDPTVYEYDSIYDDMEAKKQERERMNKAKQKDSKPKYIQGLLKAANQRKLERERQKERQIQREREKEGEEFGDKEQFVTASYKKKMQELAEDEERERREAERDGDLSKGLDMAGFYRHILAQTTGEKDTKDIKRESSPGVVSKEDDGIIRDDQRHGSNRLTGDKESMDRGKDREYKSNYKTDQGTNDRWSRQDRKRDERDKSSRRKERERERQKEDHCRENMHRGDVRGSRKYEDGEHRKDHERGRRKERDEEKGHKEGRERQETRELDERKKKDRATARSHDRSEERRMREEGHRHSSEKEKGEHESRDNRLKATKDSESDRKKSEGGDLRKEGETHPETNLDADSDLDISEESSDESGAELKPHTSPKVEKGELPEDRIKAKYARRTTEDTVMSARERYLARKMQRDSQKGHIAVEDDD